jgi:hypothetical protein
LITADLAYIFHMYKSELVTIQLLETLLAREQICIL